MQTDTAWRVDVADCMQWLAGLPDECCDLVIADPPYNIGYAYDGYDDNLPTDEYFKWQYALGHEVARVIRPAGSFFYLHYPEFAARMWCAWSDDAPEGLAPVDMVAWVYHVHSAGGPLRKGHRTWLWFAKGIPSADFSGQYRNPTDKRVARLIENGAMPSELDWWECEQVKNVSSEKTEHPCQVPETLVAKIVQGTTQPGGVVLDPFTGSGTTGAVAVRLGRKFLGCELNPEYAAMARRRIGKAQPPLFTEESVLEEVCDAN